LGFCRRDNATVILKPKRDSVKKLIGYTLYNPAGLTIIDETIASREDSQIKELKKKIFRYAQGSYIRDLSMTNPNYEFEFKLVPVDYNEEKEVLNDILSPKEIDNQGVYTVHPENDYAAIEVTNKSDKDLYFTHLVRRNCLKIIFLVLGLLMNVLPSRVLQQQLLST